MALILNGTNQFAKAALTSSLILGNASSLAITFRTGAIVTGTIQTVVALSVTSGNYRGYKVSILADGRIVLAYNFNGADGVGSAPWLGVAVANTTYRIVITRQSGGGNITAYLNAITQLQTRAASDSASVITHISLGAAANGNTTTPWESFNGQVVRAAFWPSVLSTADINVCLDQLQTPTDCSVQPQDYWLATTDDVPTIGSNSLVRMNGATYDADSLYAPSITSTTSPISVGGVFSFTGAAWVNNTLESITSNVTGATVSSITGNTTNGSATVGGWVNGQSYAETPCAITLTFNDGIGIDTESITLNPQLGYIKVPINDPILNTSGYLASDIKNQTGRTLITGDKIYHNVPGSMSDLVIESDTSYSVSNGGTINLWLWVSSGIDAGKMFEYSINISKTIISINLTACYVQSESPKIDGAYFYSDRP